MASHIGRYCGFGQRFTPPGPSPFAAAVLGPAPEEYERSFVNVRLIEQDVRAFGTNKLDIDDPLFTYVCSQAYSAFRTQPVKPIHLNDLFDYRTKDGLSLQIMPNSPGIPWISAGYTTKAQVAADPTARKSIRWFWHRVKEGEDIHAPDCAAYLRSHLVKTGETKVRAVWGYPATVTFMEACFAVPLIEQFKLGQTPIAYGYDMATGGARRLWRDLAPYKYYLCLDYKSFDKTVSAQLIRIAFDVLLQNVNLGEYADHGTPDVRRLVRAWFFIRDYFINTTIRLCTGHRFRKRAGVASGSYFTQLIDSVVNWIITSYVYHKVHGAAPTFLKVFGDDSVLAGNSEITYRRMYEYVEDVGMEINSKKCIYTRDIDKVEFLGFGIEGGFPRRGYLKWRALLYNPEYPDKTYDDLASRAVGLAYANAGMNSSFHSDCLTVIRRQPFDLALSKSMRRFLTNIGVYTVDKDLPDIMGWLIRLS